VNPSGGLDTIDMPGPRGGRLRWEWRIMFRPVIGIRLSLDRGSLSSFNSHVLSLALHLHQGH
jgi:hypothetical protein